MLGLQEYKSTFTYDWTAALAGVGLRASEQRGDHDAWREIDRELCLIASRRCELDAGEARFLREAESLQIWRRLGHASILAYMESRLGYAPRTALDRIRVARALGDLPELEQALATGALKHSAVRELTRVAVPATVAQWIARATGRNLRQIEDLVRGRKPGDQPDDPPDPDVEPRRLTLELSSATYALYRQVQAQLADECGQRLDDDALIAAMCRRSLDGAAAEPTRARHQIAVTLCERCKRGWQDGAGAVIEIDRAAIEVAECDAQHIGSLDATQPARATQDVSPATRRLVWRRDHGRCQAPGCRSARNLDVHHVVHRADAGSHEASNLTVLCSSCHAALHRGLLSVSGRAPDLVFTRHDEPRDTPTSIKGRGSPRKCATHWSDSGFARTRHAPPSKLRVPTWARARRSRRCSAAPSSIVRDRARPETLGGLSRGFGSCRGSVRARADDHAGLELAVEPPARNRAASVKHPRDGQVREDRRQVGQSARTLFEQVRAAGLARG